MATDDKALDHAWAYFTLHANQRITVFNYFVVFAGILCTGLAATMQASVRLSFVGIALGLILVMLSFLFWKLDQRTSFLIKHAEDVIKTHEPALAPLLADEVGKTSNAKANDGLWTYGEVFRAIFVAMALIGVAGATLSALRATRCLDWSETPDAAAPLKNAG
jgi:hypothetical protein